MKKIGFILLGILLLTGCKKEEGNHSYSCIQKKEESHLTTITKATLFTTSGKYKKLKVIKQYIWKDNKSFDSLCDDYMEEEESEKDYEYDIECDSKTSTIETIKEYDLTSTSQDTEFSLTYYEVKDGKSISGKKWMKEFEKNDFTCQED